jgi:hypothetical protein
MRSDARSRPARPRRHSRYRAVRPRRRCVRPRSDRRGTGWAASPPAAPAEAGPTGRRRPSGRRVDAELAGGLPQPDLARELVGLLGQLAVLPVGAGLWEAVAAQPAALGRDGAAEDPVILVEPAGRLDREIEAVVGDLAAGGDGLGRGRLGLLAGLGEEPLRVLVAQAAGSRPLRRGSWPRWSNSGKPECGARLASQIVPGCAIGTTPPTAHCHRAQPCSPSWWCGCPWSLGPSRGPSADCQQPGWP